MKPKPLSSLNHFTVPVAIFIPSGQVHCETRRVLTQTTRRRGARVWSNERTPTRGSSLAASPPRRPAWGIATASVGRSAAPAAHGHEQREQRKHEDHRMDDRAAGDRYRQQDDPEDQPQHVELLSQRGPKPRLLHERAPVTPDWRDSVRRALVS